MKVFRVRDNDFQILHRRFSSVYSDGRYIYELYLSAIGLTACIVAADLASAHSALAELRKNQAEAWSAETESAAA